ncbi:MAG: histidine phosphatase family protein [Steroidobacteraceae bacterium]
MPYVYLVRHAQPDFTGHYDSVTALGLRQSGWLGEHFAARGLRFARALSGSLDRQTGTLRAMAEAGLQAPPGLVDPRFNEYDAASVLGAFHAGDERALRAAGDRRGYFTAVRDALHAWSRSDAAIEGGESWADFGERVHTGLEAACAGLAVEDPVLIVTSGGVIGRLVASTLGAGADAAINLNLQTRNTGVTELIVGRSARRLVSFNAVPHLERADRAAAVTHS